MIDPAFELGENQEFIGQYSWRLKDGELRYRGSNQYAGLVNRRIPVSQLQLDSFIAALNLLEVWNWRDDYDPLDAGMEVLDGGQWWFRARLEGRECQSSGWNAFPSYSDPTTTSLSPQRFALLRTCLYDSFDIDAYIRQAQIQKQNTSIEENDSLDTNRFD
ncbi:MAG TPA: hypothetical protein DCY03_01875 [Planctomycetaceae bacterium]|nr:hypothetical protein [Planctomycetaceae bacterium]|tara:strand:- start:3027 stop:3509 length:483 start_codon:yes stop_codon:yes gene_type:complete